MRRLRLIPFLAYAIGGLFAGGAGLLLMVHGRQAPLAMLAGVSLFIYFLFSGWYLLRVRKGETKRRSAQVAALLMALAWLGLSFDTGRLSGLEVLALVPAFSCLAVHAWIAGHVASEANQR